MTKAIQEIFKAQADSTVAAWSKAYMRNQFPFLGVRKPLIGTLLKPLENTFSDQDILTIWNYEEREYQYAAMWLLRKRAKQASISTLSLYEKLLREKSWWDTVDEIAPHLVGSLVQRFPKLHDVLDNWTVDPHLWIRRSSIIYQLRFKEKTNEKKLFDHCLKLADDPDFFIRKAIGWSLREFRKTAPAKVDLFLANHGNQLSSLSRREAIKIRKHQTA